MGYGKYNVFKLFVVKENEINHVCKKENERFIDIFLGEEFYLSKREILLKFAYINSSKIHKDIQQVYPLDILSYQEEYLKAFNELSKKNQI